MKRNVSGVARFVVCGVLAVALFFPAKIRASEILYQFNTPFPSDSSPAGPSPWILASFSNAAPGTVFLTISNTAISKSEFASELYFNLNTNLNPHNLVFTLVSSNGGFSAPTINHNSANAYKADGDGKYDIRFNFGTANAKTFTFGEFVTYQITGIASLTALDFGYLSAPAGGSGPFFAAGHIQGVPSHCGSSTWIEPCNGPIIVVPIVPVPEPAPAILLTLASGLWFTVRFIRRRVRRLSPRG
jgi:hypothetical protein